MKRTKLKDRLLPNYTKGEEIFNMVSHIVGGGFGVIIAALCIVKSFLNHDAYQIVSTFIYGFSMIILYTVSSVYHGLKHPIAKKVMQVIDHCSVFILISGISIAKATLDNILGKAPEKQLIEEIKNIVLSFDEFVGIHDLIVHDYGPGRQFASVHVEVPQDIDIVKCHEQIDICEKLVNERLNIQLVIHMDPIDVDNQSIAAAKTDLCNILNDIDPKLSLHDFRMTPECDTLTNLIFDVVVPSSCKIEHNELNRQITEKAKECNPTYRCVITFDNDFTGE